jgi:hypothetical protein
LRKAKRKQREEQTRGRERLQGHDNSNNAAEAAGRSASRKKAIGKGIWKTEGKRSEPKGRKRRGGKQRFFPWVLELCECPYERKNRLWPKAPL